VIYDKCSDRFLNVLVIKLHLRLVQGREKVGP